MKCAADCRLCAWGDYFFDVAPPPFALSLRRSPAATSENKTRCESGGASQTFPAAASAVEPTEKHRAKPMAKLFMTVAERTSMVKAEQMRWCVTPGHRFEDIRWQHFDADWELEPLKQLVGRIVDNYSRAYVGISASVTWRWSFCTGYNDFVPHRKRYDIMFPLTAEFATPSTYLEELLIKYIRESSDQRDGKLDNSRVYRTGPINYAKPHFVYICVCTSRRC